MFERMIIAVILAIAGFLIYQGMRWWNVRRLPYTGTSDPLLKKFVPGRPAVLYFTSAHCAPCLTQQRPALARLIEDLGEDHLQIIQVDAELEMEHAQRWGVMTLPTTFILDAEGHSKAVNYGVASSQTLSRQLIQLNRKG